MIMTRIRLLIVASEAHVTQAHVNFFFFSDKLNVWPELFNHYALFFIGGFVWLGLLISGVYFAATFCPTAYESR